MQNAECRIRSGAILHSEFCILNSMLGLYIHLPFCRVHCAYCPFAISTNIGLQDDYIAFWRSLGVNRLSIGVQSFHDAELRPLGRVHGRERALEAIRDAVASGIRTSLDLILGLPNQTVESFRETLEIAIASGVGHLSLYMLDLEEGTALAKQVDSGRTSLPDEDEVASLYVEAVERLNAAGLPQYEISNFGDPCLHNLR